MCDYSSEPVPCVPEENTTPFLLFWVHEPKVLHTPAKAPQNALILKHKLGFRFREKYLYQTN